ncbi:MAG: hypothetical protein JWO98_5318 [Frankiales bacterium]|nr:hypothetical protein [Frankiales bacterium]
MVLVYARLERVARAMAPTMSPDEKAKRAEIRERAITKRLGEMLEDSGDRSHGTPTGYVYGCRCARCTHAKGVASMNERARRLRKKAEASLWAY